MNFKNSREVGDDTVRGKTAIGVLESVLSCKVPCRKHGTAANCNVLQKRNEINDKVTVKSPMWEGASKKNRKYKPHE